MKFSEFINVVYENKNKNITSQGMFVKSLLSTVIPEEKLSYDESYFKQIFRGEKPLNSTIIGFKNKKLNYDLVVHFFESNINTTRFNSLLSFFEIPNDLEQDLFIMYMTLGRLFLDFIENNTNEIENKGSLYYEKLLDNILERDNDEACKKAVFEAKKFIYKAENQLLQVNQNNKIWDNCSYFEGFFSSIKSAFYSFLKHSCYELKQLFRSFCSTCYTKDEPIDEFFFSVSNQLSESIDIKKKLIYVSYAIDGVHDKRTERSIFSYNESKQESETEYLEKIIQDSTEITHFSRMVFFSLENSERNLLNDYMAILLKAIRTFQEMANCFTEKDNRFVEIDKQIDELFCKLSLLNLAYIEDGMYNHKTKEINYPPLKEIALFGNKEKIFRFGNDTFKTDDGFPKNATSFKDRFNYTLSFFVRLIKKCKTSDVMTEFYVFNPNKTFRKYMFVPTCDARIYREIRTAMSFGYKEKCIGFFSFFIVERRDNKEEYLIGIGYDGKQKYDIAIKISDIISGNYKAFNGQLLNPLYTPMFYLIKYNLEQNK